LRDGNFSEAGFKNNQLTKKNQAVNNWVISSADKYPSAKAAMLRSRMPKIQEEVPRSQMPPLRFARKAISSNDGLLFMGQFLGAADC
jgi:hypothetical protein